MTSCKQIVVILDQYAEGELSPGSVRLVERHLAACPACRQELQVVDRVLALVSSVERRMPPADLWQRVQLEISQPVQAPWYRSMVIKLPAKPAGMGGSWLGKAFATAGVVGVIAVGVFWPRADGLDPSREQLKLPIPRASQTETASYLSQAEQASMFDPFADRASMTSIVEASSHSSRIEGSGSSSHFAIGDAISTGSAEDGPQ